MIKKIFSLLTLMLVSASGICQTEIPATPTLTEVMAWSNITGVRTDGELIDFETALAVGSPTGKIRLTGKEWQTSMYHRRGASQIVETTINDVAFTQTVTDLPSGQVAINLTAKGDNAWLAITIQPEHYTDAKIKLKSRSVSIRSSQRDLLFTFDKATKAFLRPQADGSKRIFIAIPQTLNISLTAKGTIDHQPVDICLDLSQPGHHFAGFGGNFRLQNPQKDPQVIDYCLDNLRVAFGRVEMPWALWHPEEGADPTASPLHPRVEAALQMAVRLKAQGMPVILSCWFPPKWALAPGSVRQRPGVAALRLDDSKREAIYRSLASYIRYAKEKYGIEFYAFSFNESDIGIDVLHTAEEHCQFIKDFGRLLAEMHLPTKLLLGDNSDATTIDFIQPSLKDESAWRYIAAVSFHSWRGCDDATLKTWADAARKINVPLLVAEGSTDAAAHRYNEIFNESTFALYEINLYMRLCAVCQPLSILQWQLTSDYSLLWGDGIYGSEGPMRPTQRFWNMKQLASTPEDALSIPVSSSKTTVNCAAFANKVRGEYAVHMVNNGAACEARIAGLPVEAKVEAWATSKDLSMAPLDVTTVNGETVIKLPPVSFVTLKLVK